MIDQTPTIEMKQPELLKNTTKKQKEMTLPEENQNDEIAERKQNQSFGLLIQSMMKYFVSKFQKLFTQ